MLPPEILWAYLIPLKVKQKSNNDDYSKGIILYKI